MFTGGSEEFTGVFAGGSEELLGILGGYWGQRGDIRGVLGEYQGDLAGPWGGPWGVLMSPLSPPVCKVAAHKRCESKVTSPCQALPPPELRRNTAPVRRSERVGSSLDSAPQRSTLPRTPRAPSPEPPPFPPLDLTFVTERILSVGVPGGGEGGPGGHLRHLAKLLGARHGPNYTIFNLSEKRRDLTRLNPKVLDFGWPELLAPPLELLCSVCKALEGCLGGHPRNVAVLLCKGSKAPVGVVVGAFLHYSDVWGSPEQALNALSMRRFCEEKLGGVLQPSQRRYTEDFGALLSGRLRLNSSPQFLHHVLLPPLPAYDPPDGCRPFLKIYQSLQLVYTSGVYSPPASQSLCVTLEPALLLKGDVMVRCYHRRRGGREAVFGVQFHTGTLRGPRLRLRRDELDLAWQDQRFPPDATVEFIFSSGPERVEGWVPPRGPPAAPIDYGVRDPAVRHSPEEPSHTWGPLDGSPYARVQKKGGPSPPGRDSDSPPPPGAPHGRPPPPTAAERRELEQLLGGFGVRGGHETPGSGEEPPDTPEPLGTLAPYRGPTSYGTPPPSCPHCGRPGLGLERGPPPGKGGYDPPAMGEPQEPTGAPWPGPPRAPPAPPESPRAPSPGSGTPGSPPPPQPPLPEKRHPPAPGGPRDPSSPQRSPGGAQGPPSAGGGPGGTAPGGTFVQDTTKFWYKPGLSREEAVSLLKAAAPGSFLVRRSSSFPGAFGLALRVGVPPPRATPRAGDPQEQLVRHFLIETGPRGVRTGCPEEPYFGSLPALVLQHSITPISLPCALRIPHAGGHLKNRGNTHKLAAGGAPGPPPGPPNVSTAGALLRQGAACSVLFLGSVGTEALTGPQAVAKAVGSLLEGAPSAGGSPRPPPSPVHFKVSAQGITLTDRQRKLFFPHYPVSSVTHCGTDPQDRRWTNSDGSTARIFGFVAKQAGAPGGGNVCHVFAELDPEQPGAIVTFVTKVLLGTRH
ncbi:LOW QUALITY PROTEIN: tensin-2 [Cyanocitta cristata]